MPVGSGCSGCLEAGSGWVGPPLPGQGAYRVQKVQSFAGIGEGDARRKCLKLNTCSVLGTPDKREVDGSNPSRPTKELPLNTIVTS